MNNRNALWPTLTMHRLLFWPFCWVLIFLATGAYADDDTNQTKALTGPASAVSAPVDKGTIQTQDLTDLPLETLMRKSNVASKTSVAMGWSYKIIAVWPVTSLVSTAKSLVVS